FFVLYSVHSSIFAINRVLCPSYQGFRIYRETLSRFSCAASSDLFNDGASFVKLCEGRLLLAFES
ncbi:hypothetical protein ACT6QE_03735, partial [Staphylococcus aureus]